MSLLTRRAGDRCQQDADPLGIVRRRRGGRRL